MLKITSCMSETADPFCRELAGYLSKQMGCEVVFVEDVPWQERLAWLREGALDLGWICGVDYVKITSLRAPAKQSPRIGTGDCFGAIAPRNDINIDLLAAPVMPGERYQGKPVYYSDVIVRRDSPYLTIGDLRGARWAYNEPGSFSGCLIMLHRLAQMSEGVNFFRETIESGAHAASIRMVLEGQADVAAIDSTAFDQTLRWEPEVRTHLRVVECLGPNPIPPWVVSRSLADEERDALKEVFLGMSDNPRGRAILFNGLFDRFVPVEDSDYDPIRRVVSSSPEKS